uniref:separase n=1 Tax=Ditylenchus dipsaci TaxID=166011 RepID=A0A915EMY7_9BILA
MRSLTLAYDEFKDFGHLFFREWRQRSSHYLALKMPTYWHKALYFFESSAPCIRQFARLCNSRKDEEITKKFRFDSTAGLIEAVSRLPEELTYLNFSLCEDGSLWLTRCHKDANILIRSDESVAGGITDSVIFWDVRKRLDKQVEALLHKMQQTWEGVEVVETKLIKAGYTKKSAVTLTRLMDQLGEQEWLDLCIYFGELEEVREERNKKEKYTLMSCPPSLSFLPWECLPIYERSPLVTRIPSFHLFEHISQGAHNIPKTVDGRNSFYVLNPGAGLVSLVACHRGKSSRVLAKHDLFLYMGHGSGGRHFGRSSIRESDCKAVSILMGCSSARIIDEGPGFDGRSAIYEYLIAKCPCVVGCLWMVTDGDIDRFFIALVNSASDKSQMYQDPL